MTVIFFNTLRPRQYGCHFPKDIFKCIFLNENVWISIKISLKFVPKGSISNIPALVQIMAWRRPGSKPLSESMMVSLQTHICVTLPQWVKWQLTKFPSNYKFNVKSCIHTLDCLEFTRSYNKKCLNQTLKLPKAFYPTVYLKGVWPTISPSLHGRNISVTSPVQIPDSKGSKTRPPNVPHLLPTEPPLILMCAFSQLPPGVQFTNNFSISI